MHFPKEFYAFSLYKHPLNNTINIVIQENNDCFYKENKQGFVMRPFIVNQSCPSILIKPDKNYNLDKRQFKEIKPFLQNVPLLEKGTKTISTTKQEYCNNVNNAIKAISEKQFSKVVLSRLITEPNKGNNDLFFVLETLIEKYPNAFICLLYHPLAGLWLCATPELLLKNTANFYSTFSLAGTQAYNNEDISKIYWEKKEIEEQAFVTDYIIAKINELRGTLIKKSGPINIVAGNVIHLKTEIEFEFERKINEVLNQFHPTPAICGMPKAEALAFILKNESHKRDYYTGYLGEINNESNSALYVNLRCMQITKTQNIFYAGAGITIDSDAEQEWKETSRKAELLREIIHCL